jgi:aspartate-semialdehyde dehydrogenase
VDLVFSSVPESAASDEQKILDAGILLISNNPYGRLSNPLIVPELQNTKPTGNLIKMPNCVSIGVSLALAPLLSFEIKALQATTFQSLSGQGDRLYPKEWAIGNVFPIGSDVENTQTYIGDELKTLLNVSFSPQIRSYRAYVQEGHLVDVTVSFQRAVTIQEIEHVWQSWNPLNRQSKPLTVVKKPGHPQSQDSLTGDGMAVYVGNSQQQDAYTLSFTVGVHNIIRGAAGNSVLTAEWLVGFVE